MARTCRCRLRCNSKRPTCIPSCAAKARDEESKTSGRENGFGLPKSPGSSFQDPPANKARNPNDEGSTNDLSTKKDKGAIGHYRNCAANIYISGFGLRISFVIR